MGGGGGGGEEEENGKGQVSVKKDVGVGDGCLARLETRVGTIEQKQLKPPKGKTECPFLRIFGYCPCPLRKMVKLSIKLEAQRKKRESPE